MKSIFRFLEFCSFSQAKYATLKRQNEKLQMEVMQTRVWQAQSLEEELEDEVDGKG